MGSLHLLVFQPVQTMDSNVIIDCGGRYMCLEFTALMRPLGSMQQENCWVTLNIGFNHEHIGVLLWPRQKQFITQVHVVC